MRVRRNRVSRSCFETKLPCFGLLKVGFTLLEILASLAIIAALLAMMVPMVGNYLAAARRTSDHQTLTVLNDALMRYKTQGGNLAALTSGANPANILAAMKTPVSWAGIEHSFLAPGVTYAASSLSSLGEGAQFRFTSYGSYTDGTVYSNAILSGYSGVDVGGTDEEFETWLADAMSEAESSNYLALLNPTDSFSAHIRVPVSGKKVFVWWGDGTTSEYTPSVDISENLEKNFGSATNRAIVLVGDISFFYSADASGGSDFGGDISTLKTLSYLTAKGSNTLTGSLTGRDMIYINIQGANTIGGDISDMTNLTYCETAGGSTLTGDVTNLSNLYGIRMYAANSFATGDISAATGIQYIGLQWGSSVTGTINTSNLRVYSIYPGSSISGDFTGASNMEYFYGYGSGSLTGLVSMVNSSSGISCFKLGTSHALDQSQIDGILAGFWANRDVAKARNSERAITMNQISHAAPSAAGLTDKANLEAYMSPNNTGPMVWTVNTN